MDYFHESQRRDEQARQREEVRRLELERDQKADQIRQLEERIASREQSLREKDEVLGEKDHHLRTTEELLGDNMAMLAAVRRALKPAAAEAPFPTDGIAVNRIELLGALTATINEAAGFLSGLGYEGHLVQAVVALADRATELKQQRDDLQSQLEDIGEGQAS